jgi:hypothetical protein
VDVAPETMSSVPYDSRKERIFSSRSRYQRIVVGERGSASQRIRNSSSRDCINLSLCSNLHTSLYHPLIKFRRSSLDQRLFAAKARAQGPTSGRLRPETRSTKGFVARGRLEPTPR